jgi:hypothetical protein
MSCMTIIAVPLSSQFIFLFLTVASLMVWADKHISSCQHFRELGVSIRELKKIELWINLKNRRFYDLIKGRLTIYQSARQNIPEGSYLVNSCQFHNVKTIYAHVTAGYNSRSASQKTTHKKYGCPEGRQLINFGIG